MPRRTVVSAKMQLLWHTPGGSNTLEEKKKEQMCIYIAPLELQRLTLWVHTGVGRKSQVAQFFCKAWRAVEESSKNKRSQASLQFFQHSKHDLRIPAEQAKKSGDTPTVDCAIPLSAAM